MVRIFQGKVTRLWENRQYGRKLTKNRRRSWRPATRSGDVQSCLLYTSRFLRSKGVKAIVIACNTASSYALDALRRSEDIPIIGVINAGARAAVSATKNGRIGVIGTDAVSYTHLDVYKRQPL